MFGLRPKYCQLFKKKTMKNLLNEIKAMNKIAGTELTKEQEIALIKERITQIQEATLIKSGREDLRKTDLKKDDLIYFHTSENERGMSMYTGTIIGRVSKVIGSKNVEVTAIGPASKKGNVYKVERREALLLPRKGKKIGVTAGYDYGAGSGSQGTFDYEGVVTDVDLNSATISIKGEGDKKAVKIQLKDIAKAFYL
jgi:hypothetical protein